MKRTTMKSILGMATIAMLAVPTTGSAANACVDLTTIHANCRYIVSGPGDTYKPVFTQPVVVIDADDAVTLVHADPTGLHDVVAKTIGSDAAPHCGEDANPFLPGIQRRFPLGACPIFWSDLIGAAQTTPVRGTGNVAPLTVYEFYCSIHTNMIGRLVRIDSPA